MERIIKPIELLKMRTVIQFSVLRFHSFVVVVVS